MVADITFDHFDGLFIVNREAQIEYRTLNSTFIRIDSGTTSFQSELANVTQQPRINTNKSGAEIHFINYLNANKIGPVIYCGNACGRTASRKYLFRNLY